jgi:hypothetical protein
MFCSGIVTPDKYKSKGSKVNLYYRHHLFSGMPTFGEIIGQIEGFRIQYKIEEHYFQGYTTEVQEDGSEITGIYDNLVTYFVKETCISTIISYNYHFIG